MEILSNLATGFAVALTLKNLAYCFVGVLLGTLIGVLPGIGPIATIAMLLPITFHLPPESALIMLAGIYYGAQYGGSTSAILVNLPGESSSAVTTIDGYQMARLGRAGPALAIAAIGSFFAGCVATVLIAFFAPQLAELAGKFAQADYFSLMVLGLVGAVVIARGSVLKALAMVLLGLLLGLVGTDVMDSTPRFTFGIPELTENIEVAIVAMGVFGIAEVIANLERRGERQVFAAQISRLLPSMEDLRRSWKAILRGTGLGSLLGILPGGGALLASFSAYALEKKIAKEPERFGKGAIEGVAAPEAANNAGAQTSFVPLLTLGIPTNPVMALMFGAMMIHGIAPGPNVISERPELFWGMITSMLIGNGLLLVLNLPMIGLWIKLLSVRYRLLYPAIILFCCIGVFSVNNSAFEVGMLALFSLLGYIFIKLGCEPAPFLIGFILGPRMDEYLRRALKLSHGEFDVFITRPISATLLALALLLLLVTVAPAVRRTREEAFAE